MFEKLVDAGYTTADEIMDLGMDGLKEVPGIGEKTAEKILEILGSYFE